MGSKAGHDGATDIMSNFQLPLNLSSDLSKAAASTIAPGSLVLSVFPEKQATAGVLELGVHVDTMIARSSSFCRWMLAKRSFQMNASMLSSTRHSLTPWSLVVTPFQGFKTCSAKCTEFLLLVGCFSAYHTPDP